MTTSTTLLNKYRDRPYPDKLVITPLLSVDQKQDGKASVDVRLGQEFLVADRSVLAVIDPLSVQDDVGPYLREVHVPLGEKFVLHPHQFALGATLEYIRMPGDLTAHVTGRSRWARIGLVIAMATFVQPWYAGCLTLELQNLGDAPIYLFPGLKIAQLIFDGFDKNVSIDASQLACIGGPRRPRLIDGGEAGLLARLNAR